MILKLIFSSLKVKEEKIMNHNYDEIYKSLKEAEKNLDVKKFKLKLKGEADIAFSYKNFKVVDLLIKDFGLEISTGGNELLESCMLFDIEESIKYILEHKDFKFKDEREKIYFRGYAKRHCSFKISELKTKANLLLGKDSMNVRVFIQSLIKKKEVDNLVKGISKMIATDNIHLREALYQLHTYKQFGILDILSDKYGYNISYNHNEALDIYICEGSKKGIKYVLNHPKFNIGDKEDIIYFQELIKRNGWFDVPEISDIDV